MSVYKEISAEFEKKLKRHKVKNPQIIIRKMNKRWGSCLANENKIILNLKIMEQFPPIRLGILTNLPTATVIYLLVKTELLRRPI